MLLKGLRAIRCRSREGRKDRVERRTTSARRMPAMDMKVTSMPDSIAEGFLDSREFARMTRAIEFIEREYERQPKLAKSRRFGRALRISLQSAVPALDRAHPQAISRRGHQPRRGHRIAQSEPSVLDAAHSVGLSGGGRLHDLTVTLEAMTPGEIRAGGAGVTIRHGVADTPFGTAFFAETPRGLCRLAFIEDAGDAGELQRVAQPLAAGAGSCATTSALRLWSTPSGVTKPQSCRWPCAAPTSRCRSGVPCSN